MAGESRTARRAWWMALLLSFSVLATWTIASPHMASPDEPAHAAKAAATVRGQFAADETGYRAGRGTFELPALFAQGWGQPCFAYEPDTPGGCAPEIGGDLDEIVPVESHVARYNPVYYALVGLPSLLPLSELTFTLMRVVSALINAVLIALAFRVTAGLRRPALPMLGLFTALTPSTLFIGSSLTPQGPEVFGAVLVGVCLMALVFDPRSEALASRAWTLVVGTAFFVLARGLSPGYLVLVVLFVLLAAPRVATVREILLDRRFWPPLAVCATLSLSALAYTLLSGSLALGIVFPDPELNAGGVVGRMLLSTDDYLEQVLGLFGWADTHLPLLLLVVIGGSAFAVGMVGFALAGWRGRIALGLLVGACVAVPIAVQLWSFRESGLVWQGRYVLPIALQGPLLAGFLAGASSLPVPAGWALLKTGVAVAATCQVAALAVNVHRYVNGASGPWRGSVANAWEPLLPAPVIVTLAAAAWTAALVLVVRVARRSAVAAEITPVTGPGTPGS